MEPSLIKLTDSPDNNQNISNEKSSFQSQLSEKSYSKSTDFSSKNSFNSSTDGPNNDQKISDEKSSLQSQPSEKSSSTSHASSRSSSDCSDNNQKILAIVNTQSAYRRHRAHLALKKLQVEKLEEQKSLAAVNIQRIWRGYSARLKVEKAKKPLLSYSLLEKAKPYIDNPSNLEGIPEASSGKTRVYLPKELPVVLKQSGSPANQKRFDQMKQGLDICEKSRYENLVIPKARVYGNFIVESRLPITMDGTKEQIGLYIENRERFAGAVQEFTGFLCQSSFYDITGGNRDPYGTLSTTPLGRYDNISLYLEEDKGKIGLIDLERFSPGCGNRGKLWCYSRCSTAVHLFPYHLEDIIEAAKKFDSTIEVHRKSLEIERDEALKRFKIAYEDHLVFVRKKNITLENPIAFEKLSVVRAEELKESIKIELRKANGPCCTIGFTLSVKIACK